MLANQRYEGICFRHFALGVATRVVVRPAHYTKYDI